MNPAAAPNSLSAKHAVDLSESSVSVALSQLVSPSYFTNFAKLSQHRDALAGLILARGARRFRNEFPSVSAFVAIV
jgi:hypothetical protein